MLVNFSQVKMNNFLSLQKTKHEQMIKEFLKTNLHNNFEDLNVENIL